MKFNGRSAAGAGDIGLLEAGNMDCEGFGTGSDFGPMVQGLLESELHPTVEQASTIVRSAVRNLCPQYSAAVPG